MLLTEGTPGMELTVTRMVSGGVTITPPDVAVAKVAPVPVAPPVNRMLVGLVPPFTR